MLYNRFHHYTDYNSVSTVHCGAGNRFAYFGYILLLASFWFTGCRTDTTPTLFNTLTADQTGLEFNNKLVPDSAINMINYMYFYNGAGIGAADFNNDGLIDLYFAGNQVSDRLYLNQGKLKFKEITREAGIPDDNSWSTGVSVVDLNGDGLMDIYVSKASGIGSLRGTNQLYICKGIRDGIPVYEEQGAAYGLNFSGLSTQAAFFDMDLDGDLDMFLLNHSYHQDGSFSSRAGFLNTRDSLSGDRLYRNDNNFFTDVTASSGIHSSAIGYGLGIAVSDINLDGLPDLYIGNDFHENDYLYINLGNGTFTDQMEQQFTHTSQFSMGVDIADINNDALPEIISLDMLPEDPYFLKRSLGEDAFDVFQLKRKSGYHPQFARNNLQLNQGNNLFSEIGLYAGVYATDWSWAPLWFDMDNDGLKDLFISNGIPRRLNDIDYINYISGETIQRKIATGNFKQNDFSALEQFPEIKLSNKFFRNTNGLKFEDLKAAGSKEVKTFSNGAVYADLDNDGDLDAVVSNINDHALLYENKNSSQDQKKFLQFELSGPPANTSGIGARLIVFSGGDWHTYEKYPVRGFQSSMNIPVHIGVRGITVDSILVIWPDHRYQKVIPFTGKADTLYYTSDLPKFDYNSFARRINRKDFVIRDLTAASQISYQHKENAYNEFDRELLLPHVLTAEGPALAVADINGDGLEDIFLGAAKRSVPAVYLQQQSGTFIQKRIAALAQDSVYEDVDAQWADVNGDGFPDLIVASGGNEYLGREAARAPRLYLNDGNANLTRKQDAFTEIWLTASVVTVADFNGDGYPDLFIGGRAEPGSYGELPMSYLLMNDGKGTFSNVTNVWCAELEKPGMVTDAIWQDMDADGRPDLLICYQWGGIDAFMNSGTSLVKKPVSTAAGWWNFILPVDINKDGHIDLVAGNLGHNSRLTADSAQPVNFYYADFDGNGKKEQAITYHLGGREIPLFNKMEMDRQLPGFKKKFLYAGDFARASLRDILGGAMDTADRYTATCFSNSILINDGKMNFSLQPLPEAAQLSSFRDALIVDANADGYPDILLAGNFYGNSIALGPMDADCGTLLLNNQLGGFTAISLSSRLMTGEARRIKALPGLGASAFIIAKNNGKAVVAVLEQGTDSD